MEPLKDIKIIDFLDWFDRRGYDISRYMHDDTYQDRIDDEYALPYYSKTRNLCLNLW